VSGWIVTPFQANNGARPFERNTQRLTGPSRTTSPRPTGVWPRSIRRPAAPGKP